MEIVLPKVKIYKNPQLKTTTIPLPSSKSESNRALIINALAGNKGKLENLSEARDTQTMMRLLKSTDKELDVLDAGTTMRFLTAYCAVSNREAVLTGTPRMCERPIKILVEALKELGAEIDYLKNEGYPPIHIKGFKKQNTNTIKVQGDVSSQFISALLMIAPVLEKGLTIELTGKIGSRPYIEMTLALMKEFGVVANWEGNKIFINKQDYQALSYSIESDWSGASYWFSFVALADEAEIKLNGLKKNSLQGDIKIVEIMDKAGVKAEFDNEGVKLSKKAHENEIRFDFSDCPDLAQTVAATCAAKNIVCYMTGIESLRIKETDRIAALQNELSKINATLSEVTEGEWKLQPGSFNKDSEVHIDTYDDHRMAMALAPLATKINLIIDEPEVVNKSYPSFWKDMERAGFKLNFES